MRYKLIEDNDGHWYLIPADKEAAFNSWVEEMENEGFCDDEDFETNRLSGSPTLVTFTDPKEE